MPRESPEIDDAENAMNVDKEEKTSKEDGSDAGDDNGEEYEIEQIIDAKRGAFSGGRIGYFVKWKGYGSDENSWVDEQDTVNAQELVDEYWKKNPKKKRKSFEPKTVKRARKSLANDEDSDTISTLKKRGRKSTAKGESEDEEEQITAARRTNKSAKGKAHGEPQRVHDMAKYMERENWEDLVDTVDTVERYEEGLVIYFTLKNGEVHREKSSICRQRFPQRLLTFYEGNLKWKVAESNED